MLEQLQAAYPQLSFVPGDRYCWSPTTQEIGYDCSKDDNTAHWSLLHETGHALLGHGSYRTDFELIQIEIAAWRKARQIAADFAIEIDEDHIQDCLDTYSDWLYKRSICPDCGTKALQIDNDSAHYRCHNCHRMWHVTPSRFCRSYRGSSRVSAKEPLIFTHSLSE